MLVGMLVDMLTTGDAFNLIRLGAAGAMVCGGSESCVTPLALAGFGRLRALSTRHNRQPAAASRPFDVDRDGFVIGEGAGPFLDFLGGFTGCYRVLLGFTGFYLVLPGFIRLYQVLLGFTGFYLGYTGFYWVLPGLYWVILGFMGFYQVLQGFTGFF